MKANRDAILSEILHTEAGYAERAEEGGGAVNRGVTFTVFAAWRRNKGQPDVTYEDLKALSREEAVEIYSAQYLAPVQFDILPDGVDYCVVDAAVNGGVTGSIKILQEALGFPEEKCDGHFGAVTRWAVTHRDPGPLIHRLCDVRLATYASFKTWSKPIKEGSTRTWGNVWADRIAKVRRHALAMVGISWPVPVSPPASPSVTPTPRLTPILPSPYINRLGMELLLEGWSREGFRHYVDTVVAKKMSAWRPRGIVLHATYRPTLKTWDEDKTVRKISEAQRIANMVPQWKASGFKASPHLFIDREEIWTATPLWKPGTHSPSYNATYWGIELVGDYASTPAETLPTSLRDNAVHAMACLFAMLGHEPSSTSLKYHGEDPRTTHRNCPGHAVGPKSAWESAIEARMAELYPGDGYAKD